MKSWAAVLTSQNCAVPRPGLSRLAQTVTLEELEAVHAEGGNEAVDRFLMPSDSGLLDWPLLQLLGAQCVLLA